MTEKTRAEAKARYYAERVAGYMGFRTEVRVEREDVTRYGGWLGMFPASESVWVTIVGRGADWATVSRPDGGPFSRSPARPTGTVSRSGALPG